MGTTLALQGAYNLAGALTQPDALTTHYAAAFASYEAHMRPIVERAQRLAFGGPPYGMPHLLNPETWWGIWMMRGIVALIYWSGVVNLVARVARPKPASTMPVVDYGFRDLGEWRGE